MVSILQDLREKIKGGLRDQRSFTALVIVLVAVTAFGLGRQSAREGEARPEMAAGAIQGLVAEPSRAAASDDLPAASYVGSKNGEVYHLQHCSGAKRISEANRVFFKTKAEAEAAGYRPAANCKGI